MPSAIFFHPAVWPELKWAENFSGHRPRPLFGEGSWFPIENNVARAEAYLRAKFHLDPSSRLATIHQRHRQDRQTDRTADR